ncbi:hypothetical protein DSO57_1031225 [Entomophthora muscae]|uniref:Uncharacterized protein n=1 Tax=Entomophthora muscae TaxID=34485 RepID=A0ACC2TML0_9FUNG|nr:hypothetical protein DSO57_1031225 [Entomophthora muscae]
MKLVGGLLTPKLPPGTVPKSVGFCSFKIKYHFLLLVIFLAFFPCLEALPNGSPLCEAEAEKIAGCMGGDNNPELDFKLSCGDCKFKPGATVTFKLTSKVEFFKGILIYVQGATPKDRIGSFKVDNKHYKDNEKRCKRFNYAKNSVLTHINNSQKPAATEFEWTAPKECPETMELQAAFIYNRLSNWMVIPPLKLTCSKDKEDGQAVISPPRIPSDPPTPIQQS